MNILRILVVVLLLCVGCMQDSVNLGVSMTIAKLSTNECIIEVSITNTGRTSLEFDENDLPWHMTSEALTVALVEEDGMLRNPIPRTPLILDSVVALPLILKPGGTKSESIRLDRYYSELLPALRRHDVTFLWAYRPRPKGPSQYQPITGTLTLHSFH
jgi:hypothetical protein